MKILEAIKEFKNYTVQFRKAVDKEKEFLEKHPNATEEEIEKSKEESHRIFKLKMEIIYEYGTSNTELYYTFKYSDFPVETVPLDVLGNSYFQVSQIEHAARFDEIIVDVHNGYPVPITWNFGIPIKDFKKYFKEVSFEESRLTY